MIVNHRPAIFPDPGRTEYSTRVCRAQVDTSAAMPDGDNGRVTAQAAEAIPAVLVIDDNPGMLSSVESMLEASGISVTTARDGVEGLVKFRQILPAVVVTDIVMPEQDGISTIMAMRRERPDVTIIAMSGAVRLGKSDFLTVAKQLGADLVVPKPFDANQLLAMVRSRLIGQRT